VHLLGDHIRINEDPGSDDAPHHDHGGVEEPELAAQLCSRQVS